MNTEMTTDLYICRREVFSTESGDAYFAHIAVAPYVAPVEVTEESYP